MHARTIINRRTIVRVARQTSGKRRSTRPQRLPTPANVEVSLADANMENHS
jgi:hypothetical protein